jgi:predicted outer membrane repeat protein
MKTVLAGLLVLRWGLVCFGQLSGPLSGTLGPGTYHVIDTISVNPADSLILMPATTFLFDGPFPFEIRGILVAGGIEGDSVVFTTDTVANPARWRGLRFSDSTSSASSLAYCIIENGHATGSSPYNCGGGVSLAISSPEFHHCSIRLNAADSLGGGVYCRTASSPSFANCKIIGNTVGMEGFYEGGGCGVYCDSSALSFSDCEISENWSGDISRGYPGGGVYCAQSVVAFEHCTISGNSSGGIAGAPGGGVYSLNSSLILTECTISNNISSTSGGGLALYTSSSEFINCDIERNSSATDMGDARGAGAAFSQSTALFSNCTFDSNSVYGSGGALSCESGSLEIEACAFNGNVAALSGGGMFCQAASPVFSGCSFMNNRAFYGGGVYCMGNSSPTFSNCSISANSTDGGHGGGFVFVGSTSATLTNCLINDNLGYSGGGGVYCNGASPIFTNCSINGNIAEPGPWSSGVGGGVYCYGSTTLPTFTNCSIGGNSADSAGGGMAFENASAAILDSCSINSNGAGFAGGGASCIAGSSPIFTNCVIRDNTAGAVGGGIHCQASSPTFSNCIIRSNSAVDPFWEPSGGGAYCYESSPTFSDCSIDSNIAVGGTHGGGGGVFCYSSSPIFSGCTLNKNSTPNGLGGAVICLNECAPSFDHCVFACNSAVMGGGLDCEELASPSFVNCSFIRNENGGIYCWDSSPSFNSTIIAFSGHSGVLFGDGVTIQIEYCDIFGNTDGPFSGEIPAELGALATTNGNGDSCDVYYNIYLDPMFVDTLAQDYHLLEHSPCINAGDPALPYDPDSTIADIGAFYYHQAGAQVVVVAVPATCALYPNWPNPFNPTTTIHYDVKQAGWIRLTVFNVLGQKVATLTDGRHVAGSFTLSWDAANLPSGTYLCRMEAPGLAQTRKMMVVK